MYCERCGEKLKENAAYCETCGTKVQKDLGEVNSNEKNVTRSDSSGLDTNAFLTVAQSSASMPAPNFTTPMPPAPDQRVEINTPLPGTEKKTKRPIVIASVASSVALVAIIILLATLVFGSDNDTAQEDLGGEPIRGYTSVKEMENSKNSSVEDKTNESSIAPSDDSDYVIDKAINNANVYLLPDTNTRYYSESELEELSDYALYLARNEIYARNGRLFKNQDLQDYFNSKSWYTGRYSPDSFDLKVTLNSYEKKNAETMLAIEKRRGSSYLQ